MIVRIVKDINRQRNNRIEYDFINFDYYDGIEIIADLFHDTFDMKSNGLVEGIYSNFIIIYDDKSRYVLVWHEDYGNYIYSEKQDEKSNEKLEKRLMIVVEKLNAKLDELSKKKKNLE